MHEHRLRLWLPLPAGHGKPSLPRGGGGQLCIFLRAKLGYGGSGAERGKTRNGKGVGVVAGGGGDGVRGGGESPGADSADRAGKGGGGKVSGVHPDVVRQKHRNLVHRGAIGSKVCYF